ncbi:MAG TPA: NTP transferase domain-containing protein [Thermoanaerobaculia bacterium]|nr:NTP transferase domain-containing protein [Thermoanaerobaculia bacterium]
MTEHTSTRLAGKRPAGAVLAGGRSRRLGADKTRLALVRDGRVLSLVEWAIARLAPFCDPVVVAGPAAVAAGARAIADGPAPGPAAGLLGAGAALPGRSVLALACDLPWVGCDALERLLARSREGDVDLVLFRSAGGLEPLCSLWSPAALARLAARCAAGDPSLWSLTDDPLLSSVVLDASDLGERAFFNLNRPEDLERFVAREGRHVVTSISR